MFFNTLVKVLRDTEGYYDNDGYWQEGKRKSFTAMVSIQPTSKNDMALLPGGREYQQTHTLYGARRLYMADYKPGQNADRVVIDGLEYECVYSGRWQNNLINHFKSIVELAHD